MDKPDRGDPRAMDRGELLTVLQAADWANLSVSTIRRRLEDGDLRFEIVRDKGRDVQRIRWVDFCDLYPHVLGESEAVPVIPVEEAPTAALPGQEAADLGNNEAPKASVTDSLDVHLHAHDAAPAGQEHGLQLSIQSLTEQREDLREQCYDLRIRLSAAEKERQASVGALLSAQKQILTIEGSAYAQELGPLWKRPRIWSMAAAAGLFLWILSGMFDRQQQNLAEGQAEWSKSLATQTQDRLQFQTQRLDSERRAVQDQLVRLNEHNEKQRQAIRSKLEQDQGDREQLWQQVETLGSRFVATHRLVEGSLDAENQRSKKWYEEQKTQMGTQWAAMRAESLEVLQTELARERERSQKQQQALTASWNKREQRAVLESQRLAREVGDLVSRVEQTEGQKQVLAGKLVQSQALNASYQKNASLALNRVLVHLAAESALLVALMP
ncbi:MAG: hypothetical protein ACI87O_000169 [Planctomycetota bacterium]|jgi:hypothetical protein